MKIATILGTRPQLVKAAIVSPLLRKNHTEILIHTGQHYDANLSDVFFKELGIPTPDYNLDIGSGFQGWQIGQMIMSIEPILKDEKPDLVIVYGDCNSTLAGALVANKLHIPVAHIEAGCRSFDKRMSEEANRIMVDHIADYLFCVTKENAKQLKKEGITKNVFVVGDIMYDLALKTKGEAEKSNVDKNLSVQKGKYVLATIHRAENTNLPDLKKIFDAFRDYGETIVLPLHPRTENVLKAIDMYEEVMDIKNLIITPPLSYMTFQKLTMNAKKVCTDSGGVAREAYYYKVPCITLRQSTEWKETCQSGWNKVVPVNRYLICSALKRFNRKGKQKQIFGDGKAGQKIINILNDLPPANPEG